MCLAIPGCILSIDSNCPVRTGWVDFDGVKQSVALCYVPEAEIGDYVLVHVGIAISRISPAAAEESFAYLKEMFKHEVSK